MADQIQVRCDRDRFCETMTRAIDNTNGKGGGLEAFEVVNMRTLKTRLVGIRYRTCKSDRGVLINFCPWCGTDMRPWLNA